MNNLPDNQLFSLIREDSERAFAVLFDRHKSKLFRHIYQRTQSVYETEEIMQTIFIAVWKNRHSIIIEESALPYLFGAARNSVLYYFVKNTRSQAIESLSEMQEPSDYPQEDYMVAGELEIFIDELMNKMPATMKRSFELSRKENLSVREIADQMGLSEQTVKNNLTMALQRLRLKLSDKHMLTLFMTMQSISLHLIKLLPS